MRPRMLLLCMAFLLPAALTRAEDPARPYSVHVIAPSASTIQEARGVVKRLHLIEVQPRQAEAFLVVVRSSLSFPLRPSYPGFHELRTDAESQLNISGRSFHIYIYRIDDDLRVIENGHTTYEAED